MCILIGGEKKKKKPIRPDKSEAEATTEMTTTKTKYDDYNDDDSEFENCV